MPTQIKVLLQYCCPQHWLSYLAGRLAECRWKWFKNWAIRRLIKKYQVNLQEAVSENIADYPTFNSFFTRQLKPALRPHAENPHQLISPVDGCISQVGRIKKDIIFQAKNFYFNTATLLGGSQQLADQFIDGHFATFYLAPKDYHRVHMPWAGKLRETIYIPGDLFSVNQYTTYAVPNLFARNERLVCLFETNIGPMVVILVGAMLVGSIHTAWPQQHSFHHINSQFYSDYPLLERGAEVGFFKMGSTAIILFARDRVEWGANLQENLSVKMGQAIGDIIDASYLQNLKKNKG